MSTDVEEEAIKTGLRGDELKQLEAVSKAFDRYANPLASYIKERIAPTLDPHELATAVNDVFIDLAKKAKNGQFATEGSLASLLFRMAKCNAIDLLREKYKYQKYNTSAHFISDGREDKTTEALNNDEIASHVAKKLTEAPELAAAWKSMTQAWTPGREVAAVEIVRLFKIWLGSLPPLQRKVAQVMAIYFGDVTDEEICDEIAKTGSRPPLGSVKSARKQIRDKFTSLISELERTKKA